MIPSLGIDHLYLRVENLDDSLSFFHTSLGLPLSWPVRDEPFARYAWVNAGNVQLELWEARSNHDLPAGMAAPCILGVALWARDLQQSRHGLHQLGVTCKEPKTWRTPAEDGKLAANFTNSLIMDASGDACHVFFCQWDPDAPIAPWPKPEPTAARRERMQAELAAMNGGRLGLIGLHAIHMQALDVVHIRHVWKALTGEVGRAAPNIDLHVVPGPDTRVTGLTLRVRNLETANEALERCGIGVEQAADSAWIDQLSSGGFRIELTEG